MKRIERITACSQCRALQALTLGDVSVSKLRQIVGVFAVSQVVSELRALGSKIWCCRIKGPGRDGKPWVSGVYWISDKQKELAVAVLSKGSAETALTVSTEDSSKTCNHRIAIGEGND